MPHELHSSWDGNFFLFGNRTTIGWIIMKFCIDSHDPQRMHPVYIGDPLTLIRNQNQIKVRGSPKYHLLLLAMSKFQFVQTPAKLLCLWENVNRLALAFSWKHCHQASRNSTRLSRQLFIAAKIIFDLFHYQYVIWTDNILKIWKSHKTKYFIPI